MLNLRRQRGVSLIELIIGIAVMATLLGLAAPMVGQFIQNTQIRTAAEATSAGIQFARAEAVRRNAVVRFQLFDNLTAGCGATANGGSWVVSLDDADGACNAEAGNAAAGAPAPRILQKRSGSEGSSNADLVATGGPNSNSLLLFNGLGRLVTPNNEGFTQIDITNPTGGTCEHVSASGKMRCLRLIVAPGGDVRMCDPKVIDATDPRRC